MTPKLMREIAAEFKAGRSVVAISRRRAMDRAQIEQAIRWAIDKDKGAK